MWPESLSSTVAYQMTPRFALVINEPEDSRYVPSRPKLLDQVRYALRAKHYARRTEETYTNWIKRFILYHGKRHPREMDTPEIEQFLTYLAVEQHVAASTQNQALSALLFLYQHVLHQTLSRPVDAVRAKLSQYLPVVLSQSEVKQLFHHVTDETYLLMVKLLYGSGLRLMECLRLRVKDVGFAQHQLIVRSGKGHKDRDTLLPDSLVAPLQRQLRYAQTLHQNDLERGYGRVELPHALERKYPNASQEWGWQYVFPLTSSRKTLARAEPVATIFMKAGCKKRSRKQLQPPGFTSRSVAIPCGTVLLPICSKMAMIFELFKSYWAIKASKRR